MDIEQCLDEAVQYGRKYVDRGIVADYIPELAKADPSVIGLTVVDPEFSVFTRGEASYKFSAQSISKVVIYLCLLEAYDFDFVKKYIGVTPSSKPFNSIIELELSHHNIPVNPFINAGAIVATALLMNKYGENTFEMLRERACAMFGRTHIDYSRGIFESEQRTAYANRALTYLLVNDGIISPDINVEDMLSMYFKACSLLVNTVDLASLGAMLGHKGIASDGSRCISAQHAQILRTVMATCGTYDYAGDFALLVGMPAKSGVGGGIMAASPKGYGIGVFCPGLDKHGNSYVGMRILEHLSRDLDLSIY